MNRSMRRMWKLAIAAFVAATLTGCFIGETPDPNHAVAQSDAGDGE